MESEFNLKSEIKNDVLIMHTSGYVNNEGGEKIAHSIGISFLIEVIEKLNDNDGKLIFTNLESAIEKTLTIMGLFNYAGKEATVDSALKTFAK